MHSLARQDPEVYGAVRREVERQNDGLELIASENFVSPAVLQALGSPLTNKYAEGLPGKRYYGGCQFVDQAEEIARDRARRLFGAEWVNVQPHSGATANHAVYLAFMKPGERLLGLDLAHGGHLTHGSPVNFSGRLYDAHFYGVERDGPMAGRIDYDRVRERAHEVRPRVQVSRPAFAGRATLEEATTPFKLGQRVRHASFGEGVVLSYEGAGAHTLVEVNFAEAGRKRLVLAYANLAAL